jgi:dienelactone hydrolase
VVERVEYQTGPLTRATALVLRPQAAPAPLPGLLLFHCHSGVYRWGSEKLYETPADPQALRRFRQEKYAGRSWARDLAAAGFLVVVPDAFYFGRRALGREGVDAPAHEIDHWRKASELLVAKTLLLAGHSWPALIAWEDRRALDYLCTRPEADPRRIGCLGLSLGGFRAMLLAARDQRIRAVVTAGWLTTVADLLQGKLGKHSWTVLPWGVVPECDFPGVAANACPAAFLALLCTQDHLFSLAGMQAAAAALTASYRRAGAAERCRVEFFATPHALTLPMQDLARQWMWQFLGEGHTPLSR